MPNLRSGPPASLYVAGPFAQGYTEVYNFLIPLYGLSLGMNASKIGMLVGARSLLAVFLSIHVAADGPLRHLPGDVFFVWTAMALWAEHRLPHGRRAGACHRRDGRGPGSLD